MYQPSKNPLRLTNARIRCVEVKLWGIYFLKNREELLSMLSAYALEAKPFRNNPDSTEELSYHFLAFDWERSVRSLLARNLIPFEVVSTFETNAVATEKKKVYLVEDDLDILFALNTMLEDAGYDVLLSHSTKPLMEETLPPTDLFILDKCMADGDGLDGYHKLRSRSDTRDTPVIMISALRSAKTQAAAAGINDFLPKPFDMKDLLRMVSKHTEAATR